MNEHFYCTRCLGWYERSTGNMACLVRHQPGDCCHYGDRPLTPDEIKTAKAQANPDALDVLQAARGAE